MLDFIIITAIFLHRWTYPSGNCRAQSSETVARRRIMLTSAYKPKAVAVGSVRPCGLIIPIRHLVIPKPRIGLPSCGFFRVGLVTYLPHGWRMPIPFMMLQIAVLGFNINRIIAHATADDPAWLIIGGLDFDVDRFGAHLKFLLSPRLQFKANGIGRRQV